MLIRLTDVVAELPCVMERELCDAEIEKSKLSSLTTRYAGFNAESGSAFSMIVILPGLETLSTSDVTLSATLGVPIISAEEEAFTDILSLVGCTIRRLSFVGDDTEMLIAVPPTSLSIILFENLSTPFCFARSSLNLVAFSLDIRTALPSNVEISLNSHFIDHSTA